MRGDDEIFQELLRVILRSVGFQVNFVVYLSGILRLDEDVAQIGDQMQPLAVARCDASGQIGAKPRPGVTLLPGFCLLGTVREGRRGIEKCDRQERGRNR